MDNLKKKMYYTLIVLAWKLINHSSKNEILFMKESRKIIGDYYHFSHNKISKRSISPSDHHQKRLDDDHRVIWAQQQRAKSRQKRDLIQMRPLKDSVTLNDPKWNQMWYLNRGASYDMNVIPAWREGITGKGVVVTILDDGLETDHPDLIANYDKKASYDVNSHDEDPMPHYDMTDSNRHGTRCAGEVAATANNTICAVGIAFGARVGGVRMLDGDVTDAVEAKSLSLNPQHIDIYSASWGPDDDGKTVDGPGEMASRAFIEGVTKGRGGRGSIFIWASGNGGREHDNCNCDGYTNSIWTLSISSATEDGYVPWYSEMCSSTLATTYSSGNQGEKQIVTTDLHHSCTSSHTGTSASAPLAAGIVALVLEANKNLTWRDLQHIVVRTAKPMNLRDHNWSMNGVGRRVSHSFGYGLMDAVAMVRTARTWKTVPEQQRCEINAPHLDKTIPPKSQVTLQLAVQHCRGVNFLEHVQAKISLTSQRRGDIQIYLTSPAGTRVTLLTLRAHDVSRSGFAQWPFMSVHTWGEAPHGNWQLEIQNEGRFMGHAALKGWSLIFYGTTQPIDRNDPRSSTPHPPPSSFNNINYSISPPYKPQQSKNMNNNRKQNGQQQTYAMVTAPNKKNNEKKMKGNAGKNNNGKNGGNHRTTSTTTRPFQTTYYVSSSNRKYEYFSPPSHLRTTTLRPKQNPLFTNILGNRGGEKYQPYEKTPIKAPKQVKENVYTTATNHMETIDTMPTSNPNIQRMFQQYKKIQEIYPEFHPYTTTRVTNHSPSQKYSPPPFSVSQHQQQQISQYSGSSNGKPSRENSKFMFFPEPDFSGSSTSLLETQQQKKSGMMFTSSSGASSSVGGHDRGISSSGSAFISSSAQNQKIRKGNNAQITQWDLIFYGTEVSSQPDDPPRYVKSGLGESTYGSEMEHNSLEFGGETASGQWRDTHQVGESHVDIQRTTGNDQLPGSSCLHLSPDNKCLECVHGLYLYEGNCYESCPDRTYIAPESPSNTTTVKKIDRETAQLSLRSIKREIVQKLCYACHGSCFRCVGPFDFDCRECDADFIHTVVSPNEQYCIPKAKNIKIDSYLSTENLIYYVVVVLAAFGMISFFFCLLNLMKRILSSHMEKEYTYDQIKTRDESHNIKTYYSDSEVG